MSTGCLAAAEPAPAEPAPVGLLDVPADADEAMYRAKPVRRGTG